MTPRHSFVISTVVLRAIVAATFLIAALATAGAQPAIEGYSDYAALTAQLKALDESDLASLTSLGKTLGGREVWLLTVSAGDPAARPAILVVGNVEASHLVGSEVAVRIAQQLVGPKADKAAARKLLERVTLYVIPRPNPDASEHFFRRPSIEHNGNERATDDDRDGEVDEDPPQDLNGDGVITMMRVEDASGAWLPHPADPRVLIKADPKKNEHGRYALYVEGRDDDGDEAYNEDGPGGVSFNRNFPHRYAFFEPLSGPHQVSEIESRAVADFAFGHPNIALVFSFSPEDNLMEPWKAGQGGDGRPRTSIDAGDADYVNYLAEQYRSILGAKDAPSSPAGAGSFTTWAYYQFGRWSLAARGWWIPKVAAKSDTAKPESSKAETPKPDAAKVETPKPEATKNETAKGESPKEPAGDASRRNQRSESAEKRGADDVNALAWFKQQGIDGFVDWKAIEHPDFPGKKVEVGGFKPYVRLNPPAVELDPLADKHSRFLTKLVDSLPRASIVSADVNSLGGGVFRVTAEVINQNYLPTMAVMGRTSGEVGHLQIKLNLPEGAKLLSGSPRSRLAILAGNGGKTEQTWLVSTAAAKDKEATITVSAATVAGESKTVELK